MPVCEVYNGRMKELGILLLSTIDFFSDEVVHPHVPVGDFPFVLLLELRVLLDAGAVAGDDLLYLQLVHQLRDVADFVGRFVQGVEPSDHEADGLAEVFLGAPYRVDDATVCATAHDGDFPFVPYADVLLVLELVFRATFPLLDLHVGEVRFVRVEEFHLRHDEDAGQYFRDLCDPSDA